MQKTVQKVKFIAINTCTEKNKKDLSNNLNLHLKEETKPKISRKKEHFQEWITRELVNIRA